jgi:hypothetical protein
MNKNTSTTPRASYESSQDTTTPADDIIPGWTTISDHPEVTMNNVSGWGTTPNNSLNKVTTNTSGNKNVINDNTNPATGAPTTTSNNNNTAANQSTVEDEIDTWSYIAAVDNNDVMNNTFTSNTKSPDRNVPVQTQTQTMSNNNNIKTTIAMPGGPMKLNSTTVSTKNGIGVGVNAGYNGTTGTKTSTVLSSSIHNNSINNKKDTNNNKGVSWTDDNVTVGNTAGGSSAISVASSTYGEDRQRVQDQNVLDPYGDRGTYTGIILRSTGMPHGTGTMIYQEDHRTYVGEWRHGRWHGHGTATFANGDSYVGEWNDGRVYDGYVWTNCFS